MTILFRSSMFAVGVVIIASVVACQKDPAPSHGELYEAHCTEPLPVFTLGENSHPNKAQEASLCSCVWENLQGWEREAAQKIAQGRESELSEIQRRGFVPRFGNAVAKCDGMKL